MRSRQILSASRRVNAFLGRRKTKRPVPQAAGLERLEDRTLLAATVGVYDENVVNTNTVDFVATGSSFTNTQFAADMAIAFSRDTGGVIDSVSTTFHEFGVNRSKQLVLSYGTTGVGGGPAFGISGGGSFASTSSGGYDFTSYDFLRINDVATSTILPNEKIIKIGVTVTSTESSGVPRDYGIVTVTGRLASGGTMTASRAIKEAAGLGDTFYGLAAPTGDHFLGFDLRYSGSTTQAPVQLRWDDVGFITSSFVANEAPVANADEYTIAKNTSLNAGTPILDQAQESRTYSFNASSGLTWQQQVRAGGAGTLHSVDLYVFLDSDPGAYFDFYLNRGAAWQSDTPDYVTRITLTSDMIGRWITIDVSDAGFSLAEGELFTFGTLALTGSTGKSANLRGSNGALYGPGDLWESGTRFGDGSFDLAFRTKFMAGSESDPGVLANDTDAEGDSLTAVLVKSVHDGTLVFNADGSFVYTPNAGFVGDDEFTYRASDAIGPGNITTVTIHVGLPGPPLTLTVSVNEIAEGGGAVVGTVTRTGDLSNPLIVRLSSSDTSEATVPATVTILAGQASATFAINAVDDAVVDGDQSITITASYGDIVGGSLTLDSTFGSGGVVTPQLYPVLGPPFGAVIVQPDGKTIAVAEGPNQGAWRLTRFNVDGSLDTSFGSNGITTTQVDPANYAIVKSVVLQSDGKILVGGRTTGSIPVLARYNANGTIDTAFGTNGFVQFGVSQVGVEDIAVMPNGSILAALSVLNGAAYFKVARITSAGQLDTSFGSGGIMTSSISAGTSSIDLLYDGKFLLTGSARVARFRADGSLDTSFGTNGFTQIEFGRIESAIGAIVLPNGRIVIGFSLSSGTGVTNDFGLAQLKYDGSLDTSFGNGGIVITDVRGFNDFPSEILAQSDGKILLAGHGQVSSSASEILLARYNSDGTLDTTFDGDGRFSASLIPGTTESLLGAAVGSDKLVVFGGQNTAFRIARYNLPGLGASATASLTVADTGVLTPPVPAVVKLTVTIDPFVISERLVVGGDPNATTSATGTVTREGDLSLAIEVFLTSSDPTKVAVPTSVIIAAGQASATFSVNAIDDAILSGSKAYLITATTEPPPGGLLAPDGGFGTNGVATTSLTMRYQPPKSPLAVQPDGKVLVASEDTDSGSWRIVRHNADGTIDMSFGTNGVVTTVISAGALSIIPRKIVVQSDGKILVGGEIYSSTGSVPVFARYLANGTLDTSFRGGNGNGVGTVVGVNGWVADFGIRTDGKIWVALGFNGGQVVKVIRLTSSGFHDTTFNGGNARDYTGLNFSASRLVVTQDNGFLVAGDDSVARMDASGNVVTSFGDFGVATVEFGVIENVVGLAQMADGKIVVGYYLFDGTTADFAAARLTANGSLDATFSGDGKVVVDFAGMDDYAATMVVEADGKILLGGWTDAAGGTRDSALARIGLDGELDATFDGDGKFTTSLTSTYTAELITGMAVQGNTLVALGGWGNDFKLARYVLPGVTTSAARNVIVFDDETIELVVDTLVDENDGDYSAGDLSLREAAFLVSANGTIRFDASLAGGTINLTLGTISIGQFSIIGLGADQLTIKGSGTARVFVVNGPNTSLSGVTITGTGIDNLYGLQISDCIFLNNTSTRGGAIQNRGGTLTIDSTIFRGNSASWGGAIFNDSLSGTIGVVSIVDSVIQGNTASSGGGGIYALNGTDTTLVGVTISGNSSSSSAGGLFSVGTLTMINVTVSGNTAVGEGGGLDIGGPTTLRNVTIFGNRAGSNGSTSASGGGIRRDGGVTTVHNTLVAGNLLGSGAGTANDVRGFGTTTGFNNLIADGSSSSVPTNGVNGNIVGADWTTVIDPVLRDNGGPTMTHALLRTGAARDAGSSAQALDAAGNPLVFDQRGAGFARTVGPAVDIGAFELPNAAPLAKNDDIGTPAGSVLRGNLFANNGSGVDSDPDGDSIVVSAVNGNMAAVGTTVTLASGALLRVNADGSFTYDPNGMFADLGPGQTRLDQFVYRISDGVADSTVATVTIVVSGANDAPAFGGSFMFSVVENSAAGTAVGSVVATDPDGDEVRYSIVAGNGLGAFTIDAVTGSITVADASKLDFETTPSFVLTVRATEQAAGMLFGETSVTVSLLDVASPHVTQVRYGVVDSTRWVDAGDLDGRTASWKIDRIAITFDVDVAVTIDSLSVFGVLGGSYALANFFYNDTTRTAEWTLVTPVDRDRLTLMLQSDGANAVSHAGESLAGEDREMSLDVLFGDVDGNGTVNLIDALLQRGRNGTNDIWADIDGNGVVNLVDALLLRGRNGTTLVGL